MMRPILSARTTRASSGVSLAEPLLLPRKETAPMPGAAMPEPDIEAVVRSESTNGISATWTEPATDFSTKELQRAPEASRPETRLAMS